MRSGAEGARVSQFALARALHVNSANAFGGGKGEQKSVVPEPFASPQNSSALRTSPARESAGFSRTRRMGEGCDKFFCLRFYWMGKSNEPFGALVALHPAEAGGLRDLVLGGGRLAARPLDAAGGAGAARDALAGGSFRTTTRPTLIGRKTTVGVPAEPREGTSSYHGLEYSTANQVTFVGMRYAHPPWSSVVWARPFCVRVVAPNNTGVL